MGWASASGIFDPVAQALIDLDAPADMKRKVLGTLLRTLRDNDWDTYDESREEFRDDPVVMSVFAEHDCYRPLGGWHSPEGTIGFDSRRHKWTLDCSACGLLGTRPETAAGHDELIRMWVEHERDRHDGDGVVPQDMLIDTTPGGAR